MVIIIVIARLASYLCPIFKSVNHEVPPMWIRVEAEDLTTKGMSALQGENGLPARAYGGA